MNRKERKLVAWYGRMLEQIAPLEEAFADDTGPYPDSAAMLLARCGLVPADSLYYVQEQIIAARKLCDKWGKSRQ